MEFNKTISVLGLVIALFLPGQFAYNAWNSPDVGYEVGEFYRVQDGAVASLRIENYGQEDANDLRAVVVLPEEITDISASAGTQFRVLDGGQGSREALITVDRVVPGQSLYLYIAGAVSASSPPASGRIVRSLHYAGGTAEEGVPFRAQVVPVALGGLLGGLVLIGLVLILSERLMTFHPTFRRMEKNAQEFRMLAGVLRPLLGGLTNSVGKANELSRELVTALEEGADVPEEVVVSLRKFIDSVPEVPEELADHAVQDDASTDPD